MARMEAERETMERIVDLETAGGQREVLGLENSGNICFLCTGTGGDGGGGGVTEVESKRDGSSGTGPCRRLGRSLCRRLPASSCPA